MDIKKRNTNFSVEQLLTGDLSKQNFQINYQPMWQFLDNWERKLPTGFNEVQMKDIFEGIYEYAIISVSLDKADTTTRIDNLNAQNLKWYTMADALQLEVSILRAKLEAYEANTIQESTNERVSVPEEVIAEVTCDT